MSYKKYDEDTLKKINESVNLLDYVGQQIDLTKRAGDYYGHCTLHTDLTPSFSISPEANLYYCFSCGKGGGIISYLINYEGKSFDEAVEKAAKLANVDLSKMCRSETIMFLKELRACSTVKKEPFQHVILPESAYQKFVREPVQEWLDEGIEQCVMDDFDIRVDNDANRIVYPVRDIDGRLINVKARTRYANYKSLRIPKYINYYQIGVMDYFQSLDISLPFVKQQEEIILFESIKSTMKAYGWGCKNCVSAEKHTLTPQQISLLVSLRANVVFAWDSDISYWQGDVRKDINALKRFTNVYVIEDPQKLLGGTKAKNSPVDCGRDIWQTLYANKRKVV